MSSSLRPITSISVDATTGSGRVVVDAPQFLKLAGPPISAGPLKLETLKIIVVGTPKAGNTWVKHLLSVVYGLPIVGLNPIFSHNNWAALGPRWISQQHYDPTEEAQALARESGVVFIAPVRHPADVLVSLRHYVAKRGAAATANPLEPESMLMDAPGVYGEHTQSFLRNGFPLLLHLSIYWLREHCAYAVSYEELWRNPVETLRALTERLIPVSERALWHAVCACEADLMRNTIDVTGGLVRKGGIGSWREELPGPIKACLATHEPYPDQFAALGYTMTESDPDNARLTEPASVQNPFKGLTHFANGDPITPILMRAYFEQPLHLSKAWNDATVVKEGSYHAWLRKPAAADPHEDRRSPIVSELAYYLRSLRPDLQEVFTDPFGVDRVRFCHWFIFNAIHDFQFDRSFTMPVLSSWARGSSDDTDSALASRTGT